MISVWCDVERSVWYICLFSRRGLCMWRKYPVLHCIWPFCWALYIVRLHTSTYSLFSFWITVAHSSHWIYLAWIVLIRCIPKILFTVLSVCMCTYHAHNLRKLFNIYTYGLYQAHLCSLPFGIGILTERPSKLKEKNEWVNEWKKLLPELNAKLITKVDQTADGFVLIEWL